MAKLLPVSYQVTGGGLCVTSGGRVAPLTACLLPSSLTPEPSMDGDEEEGEEEEEWNTRRRRRRNGSRSLTWRAIRLN